MWKKLVVKAALRALGIEDEIKDCPCDLCSAVRKVLGLLKLEA